MDTSILLARILGICFLVISVGILANLKYYTNYSQNLVKDPMLITTTALIDLTIGAALIGSHNHWAASWIVIVTIIGWLIFVRGAVRLLIPQFVLKMGPKIVRHPNLLTGASCLFLLIGLFLSYKGFISRF
jgi:hypothetical protein